MTVSALAAMIALLSACRAPGPSALQPASGRPQGFSSGDAEGLSVVLIMTDDQRADAIWPMLHTRARLVDEGLYFDNAYVNTPMCCPTRASIAAGGFLAQDTGVLGNYGPNGGNGRFDDSSSLSLTLQGAGYRTGMIGKYLHETGGRYVPPGWTTWVRPDVDEDWNEYPVAIGTSGESAATSEPMLEVSQYLTDYLTDESLAFLDETGDAPFFLWLNHYAPHYPATPAAEDAGRYAGYYSREGAFDEVDVSDKPTFFAEIDRLTEEEIAAYDTLYQGALESLLAVDRSVSAILDHLEESGRIDDTVVIFTSDNGMSWGEHRLYNKGLPWEESVLVPLIVRAPGGDIGDSHKLVSVSTDLPATILDLAGIEATTGGRSLEPILAGQDPSWRTSLLIEGFESQMVPPFAGLITHRWKYIRYATGDEELYDRWFDPYERWSLHAWPSHQAIKSSLAAQLEPRMGVALGRVDIPLTLGEATEIELTPFGGTAPFTWSADSALPDGLTLSADGVLAGVPTETGTWKVGLHVEGSRVRSHDGELEDVSGKVYIDVTNADEGDTGTASSLVSLPPPAARAERTAVEVLVPAPPGVVVSAYLSGSTDFDDSHHASGVGPEAVLRFDDLLPGKRYRIRVEGGDGVHDLEVTTAR
ncbi:sulfatase-like hydrolase/transferase [Myxococcota bacterium]|nr:sulfatase-like hydrolase/transferase [Myxococcota bacterium]